MRRSDAPRLQQAWTAFASGLNAEHARVLLQHWQYRQQSPPTHWPLLYASGFAVGVLSPPHVQAVSDALTHGVDGVADTAACIELASDKSIHLRTDCGASVLSQQLQRAMLSLQAQGLLPGWRDEQMALFADVHHQVSLANVASELYPERLMAIARFERAGFQLLGSVTHAVHVNAITPAGLMWCARRALHKATDPGRLDNVCAGGMPAGESALTTLAREMMEEAGTTLSQCIQVQAAGLVRSARPEPAGWHDEYLHVFNVLFADDWQPCNTDGEVSAFSLLEPAQVVQAIAHGDMTQDAALAVVQGLRSGCAADITGTFI